MRELLVAITEVLERLLWLGNRRISPPREIARKQTIIRRWLNLVDDEIDDADEPFID